MSRVVTMVEKEYIEIPKALNEKTIIGEYGAEAFRFYQNRIREREYQGRKYLNPLKTIYIWAYQDRKTRQGYWSTWTGVTRKKHKNHGGS